MAPAPAALARIVVAVAARPSGERQAQEIAWHAACGRIRFHVVTRSDDAPTSEAKAQEEGVMNERDEKALKDAAKEALNKQQLREAVKEAYREIVEDYVRKFGWWSLKTLAAIGTGAIIAGAIYVQAKT